MNKPVRYERPLLRLAMLGGVCGALGALVSRFVVTRFTLSDSWVGPAVMAGITGLAVLAAMLLPLFSRRRRTMGTDT